MGRGTTWHPVITITGFSWTAARTGSTTLDAGTTQTLRLHFATTTPSGIRRIVGSREHKSRHVEGPKGGQKKGAKKKGPAEGPKKKIYINK